MGSSWVTWPPAPLARIAKGCPGLPDLKGWSSPGFYGLGLVFPAMVSQKGDGPGDADGHKGLAVLPCALLGQGQGRGGLLSGDRLVGVVQEGA